MDKDEGDDDETQGKTRFPVLPSLIALQQMRNRLATAMSGRKLMSWSAMATGGEMRKIAKELARVYASFTEDVADAFMLLARCRYFYPNLNKMVVENYPFHPCVTVGKSYKSIAGCKIAIYLIEDHCPDSYPHLGIDKGGQTILETKRAWHELLRRVIYIEQLRTNFHLLEESHKESNKKAKVLGKVIIPRTQVTIRYILSELEELEREEFFRLKKVLEVKNRNKKKQKGKKDNVCPKCKEERERREKEEKRTAAGVCAVCEGPMRIPSRDQSVGKSGKKPRSDDQISREYNAVTALKDSLDRVLAATESYEKKTSHKGLTDFKRTTEELKKKLRTPPTSIPDDVDVNLLCDLCKDLYDEQNEKCIVCHEPIGEPDDADAVKQSRRQLRQQLDSVLSAIKQYESEGQDGNQLAEFKQTAADLKKKLSGPPIPKNVKEDRLCMDCKERMKDNDYPAHHPHTCNLFDPPCTTRSKASIKSTMGSTVSSEIPLGVFETEEITEIIQVKNPDGTVSEKRRTITIRRKPMTTSNSVASSHRDRNVGLVSVIHNRKGVTERRQGNAKSEFAISSLPMADVIMKTCVSFNFENGSEEVLEKVTELVPLVSSNGSENVSDSLDLDALFNETPLNE